MDESYLLAAVRYVEMNPVRARLVEDPFSWPWSSALAHLTGLDDKLVKVAPLLEMAGDWKLFLGSATEEEMEKIRRHERSGRPLGSERFVVRLESTLERLLTPGKPGPKGKGN
jgi:putative transposase